MFLEQWTKVMLQSIQASWHHASRAPLGSLWGIPVSQLE
jgi:hypothetical protein